MRTRECIFIVVWLFTHFKCHMAIIRDTCGLINGDGCIVSLMSCMWRYWRHHHASGINCTVCTRWLHYPPVSQFTHSQKWLWATSLSLPRSSTTASSWWISCQCVQTVADLWLSPLLISSSAGSWPSFSAIGHHVWRFPATRFSGYFSGICW